jgi:hypothetical protein
MKRDIQCNDSVVFAEFCKQALYADCRYAECLYSECRYTVPFIMNVIIVSFAEFPNGDCHYAESL